MADIVDDETAAAVLAVHLQDINDLHASFDHGETLTSGDEYFALHMYREELEHQVAVLRDRQIAISFGESPQENELIPEPKSDASGIDCYHASGQLDHSEVIVYQF